MTKIPDWQAAVKNASPEHIARVQGHLRNTVGKLAGTHSEKILKPYRDAAERFPSDPDLLSKLDPLIRQAIVEWLEAGTLYPP